MTIARPKRLAVSPSTEAMAPPSRRCRCQSSGRVMVSRSMKSILLGSLHGDRVEIFLRHAADFRGELCRLARGQVLEQDAQDAPGFGKFRLLVLARTQDENEFPGLAVRARRKPRRRFPKGQAHDLLEFLADL